MSRPRCALVSDHRCSAAECSDYEDEPRRHIRVEGEDDDDGEDRDLSCLLPSLLRRLASQDRDRRIRGSCSFRMPACGSRAVVAELMDGGGLVVARLAPRPGKVCHVTTIDRGPPRRTTLSGSPMSAERSLTGQDFYESARRRKSAIHASSAARSIGSTASNRRFALAVG